MSFWDDIGISNPISTIADSIFPGTGSIVQAGADAVLPPIPGAPAPAAAPTPPTLLTPESMPSLTSGDQRTARRRAGAQALARKGRASTMLTNDDPLGA